MTLVEAESVLWITVLPPLYAWMIAPGAPKTLLPVPTSTTEVPGMIVAPLTTAGAAYKVTPLPTTAFWNRPPSLSVAIAPDTRLGSTSDPTSFLTDVLKGAWATFGAFRFTTNVSLVTVPPVFVASATGWLL